MAVKPLSYAFESPLPPAPQQAINNTEKFSTDSDSVKLAVVSVRAADPVYRVLNLLRSTEAPIW